MDRLTLFRTARAKTEALHVRFPEVKTVQSIIRQIDYLLSLETGQSTDRSRLSEIVLGIQAAREIEPLDNDLAETLYAVSDQAKKM
jgi:hypothetical protein